MADRDYYADLGVAKDAAPDDIRRAFRKLAAQYHPDRHPGDKDAEARFKKIAEAYNVLDDPKARAAYDRGGQTQVEADTGFRGFNTTEDVFSRFGDVFGDLFGDRVRQEAARESGEDYEVELTIPFEEAVRGGKNTFAINAPGACEICHGTGSSDGQPHPCATCRGRGQVSQRARKTGGFFSVTTPCPACQGRGTDPGSVCARCSGRGIETRSRTIEVSIPRAVSDGTVLRLRQMGAPGRQGGPPGDLRIRIRIQPGGPFKREGLNLMHGLTVDLLTAVLGGTVEVPLVEGKAEMRIPPGTQPGQQFRLSGQGLSDGQGKGDLMVTVQINIPLQLSEKERELFEKLRATAKARQ
jgi:molecular chaperone DnaJ